MDILASLVLHAPEATCAVLCWQGPLLKLVLVIVPLLTQDLAQAQAVHPI
jgi:hypothetical protein